MTPYTAPDLDLDAFNCPHCGAYANQLRLDVKGTYHKYSSTVDLKNYQASKCARCNEFALWVEESYEFFRLLNPEFATPPSAHADMPLVVADHYNEARAVYARSPKAAAALLRLALQHFTIHQGLDGKNLNNDIKELVKQGLSPIVQKALDGLRVIGNNAVHPGTIDISDTPELAISLFNLMNFTVEELISKPKQINEIYSSLPAGALEAIEKRDAD